MQSHLPIDEYRSAKARKTLSKGLLAVAKLVVPNPALSFPQMAGNGSQLNNIYRFVGHEDIEPSLILEPHFRNTVERVGTQEVLALHDSTDIVFPGMRGDLGYINRDSYGFKAHVSLIVSAEGKRKPLGVLGLETINRSQDLPPGTAKERRKPAQERRSDPKRESERWWRGIERVENAIGNPAAVINIGDSETDNYALIARSVERSYRFVFRVAQDRAIEDANPEFSRLFQLRAASSSVLEREVAVSKRGLLSSGSSRKSKPPRESRIARLHFAAHKTKIVRPANQDKMLAESVPINLVHIWEVDAPDDEKPIEWLLFTTEPVDTNSQIEKVIDWYRTRWLIEEFFKGLKTICRFEARQLESYHSLANALALFLPCVWHILLLRYYERHAPEEPATALLSTAQIAVLENVPPKKLKKGASIKEAYRLIAAWGGHLSQNGEPGWQTLYVGYKKLQDAALVWEKATGTQN